MHHRTLHPAGTVFEPEWHKFSMERISFWQILLQECVRSSVYHPKEQFILLGACKGRILPTVLIVACRVVQSMNLPVAFGW